MTANPLAYLAVLALVSGGLVAASSQRDNSPPFIELDVVVSTQGGDSVPGLRLGDFEVREDGRRVTLETITERQSAGNTNTEAGDGRTVVILLDDLGLAETSRVSVREIARAVLAYADVRDDISVVRLSHREDEPLGDLQGALARVEEYRPGIIPFNRRSASREAFLVAARVSRAVGQSARRRKALVCIGTSAVCNVQDDLWWGGAGGLKRQRIAALAEASDANLAVYGILPAASAQSHTDGIIEATGGRLFGGSTGLRAAIQRIWLDASHHYLLGYWGAVDSRDTHRIEVRVTKPRVKVLARRERGRSGP